MPAEKPSDSCYMPADSIIGLACGITAPAITRLSSREAYRDAGKAPRGAGIVIFPPGTLSRLAVSLSRPTEGDAATRYRYLAAGNVTFRPGSLSRRQERATMSRYRYFSAGNVISAGGKLISAQGRRRGGSVSLSRRRERYFPPRKLIAAPGRRRGEPVSLSRHREGDRTSRRRRDRPPIECRHRWPLGERPCHQVKCRSLAARGSQSWGGRTSRCLRRRRPRRGGRLSPHRAGMSVFPASP
jgi:hypothetical protein